MNYLQKNTKEENVIVAKELMAFAGVDVSKVQLQGYSTSNGVSIYFSHTDLANGKRIRVSGHGISNKGRMEDTICFSFDAKYLNGSIKSNKDTNKMFVDRLYSFLK